MADTILIFDAGQAEEETREDGTVIPARPAWPKGSAVYVKAFISGKDLRRMTALGREICEAEKVAVDSAEGTFIAATATVAVAARDIKGAIYEGELPLAEDVRERYEQLDENCPLAVLIYAATRVQEMAASPFQQRKPVKSTSTA